MDKSTHFVFFFQNITWLTRFKTEVPPKWCDTWKERGGREIKSASLNQGAQSENLNFPGITSQPASNCILKEIMLVKFTCVVVTRALFILVSLIGVWRVTWVKNNNLYWFLTILYLPLVAEMILTLRRRKGKDYKW